MCNQLQLSNNTDHTFSKIKYETYFLCASEMHTSLRKVWLLKKHLIKTNNLLKNSSSLIWFKRSQKVIFNKSYCPSKLNQITLSSAYSTKLIIFLIWKNLQKYLFNSKFVFFLFRWKMWQQKRPHLDITSQNTLWDKGLTDGI